jgi:NIPSNAP
LVFICHSEPKRRIHFDFRSSTLLRISCWILRSAPNDNRFENSFAQFFRTLTSFPLVSRFLMKNPTGLFALLSLLLGFAFSAHAAAPDTRVYELRTYTATPGKIENVIARFRDHTTRIFAKHGMVNIGYWVPVDAADGAGEKLVYLLEHKSREAATASWAAFRVDPEWQAVAKASEADGKIVAKAESVFLALTDYSEAPVPKVAATPRIFELRNYTTPEGKLDALDARFRGGETALFAKSGMTGVAYFHPVDADKGAGHTLIYLLAHADRAAAKASWAKFSADPEWVKMKEVSEKDGKLTSQTKGTFLTPVDFSMMK